MNFIKKIKNSCDRNNSLLQVSLDPDPKQFPKELSTNKRSILEFCKGIIEATAEYISSIKIQIAYFSAYRAEDELEEICSYIRNNYPYLPIILDSKRGDIGNTSEKYAIEAFDRYKADALTVNPFMGLDSIEPYLEWKDRGVLVLCRTSNPGGSDFQSLKMINGTPLYLHIAQVVSKEWNTNSQFGLVAGATFPKELSIIRKAIGEDMPLLIPGIGAQGGDIYSTVVSGTNSNCSGAMISSSRSIIYASNNDNWREASSTAAKKFMNDINLSRNKKMNANKL
ncbi:orotidine-5'-phosphate decarboxylase [Candidatus Kinetoplastibacterium blastocrithidii TCC012E]|uniref:Orotidine-5'-phosphate decarboxylase n=1 Tax=Candidatus Kinetoplastidibacterium blastocrithidiae TCC012E TaxID=1208922 RepID=M1LB78_9PROT|nr:orotidine-5'-phosphate decarboxylase [Candidatus Kinetoplastibacterium blastocrithidii]AFZ83590.1 orotidine 5'-phosphate decarboxylase [Candidatus Kinetoplastibacterium blastocrithidii (ex Strigomonas culicis)]AGF49708.1 orotidine-5'-phosphate decarboxylase [Candidatus Kinetoplastibacterium blastocrithidii TCC012E]